MALVAAALVLGGGGTYNPQTEMILEALTALLVIPLVASPHWQRGLGPVSGSAWLLAGLVLAIPVLQLVPLPPAIWHALPGRAVEVQSLALVQADQRWMPLSMAPARTFASLLAMICPVLLFLQISRLSLRGRNWVSGMIVVLGAASLVLGVLQLSHTGGWDWSLYSYFNEGFLVGFQANRNAEADVLLITMLAYGVLIASRLGDKRPHSMTWIGLVLGLVPLLIGVFMTGSRTGIALSAAAAIMLAVMLWPALRMKRKALVWLAGAAISFALVAAALLQLPAIRKVIDRFAITKEARWDLWADTSYAIHQVWPFGSGIGTIVPMLEGAERLEVVNTFRPGRAHNDWLEWTLEAGAPGFVVLALIAMVVATLIVRALMASGGQNRQPMFRAQCIFACGVLLVIGLHSIVDYPLRSMALAALAAVAVGFLTTPAAMQQNRR